MSENDVDQGGGKGEPDPAARALRVHARLYLAAMAALLLIDLLVSGASWFYWPALVWGTVLGGHYLYVRSTGVDDGWVQRRTDDIRYKSYDLQHIRDIEERYEKGEIRVPPRAKPKG
jgi:hypothetical protein